MGVILTLSPLAIENSDCVLPCWNGIDPEFSTYADLQSLATGLLNGKLVKTSPLDSAIDDANLFSAVDFDLGQLRRLPASWDNFDGFAVERDATSEDLVQLALVFYHPPPGFTIYHLLRTWGKPDAVGLGLVGPRYFEAAFSYDTKRTIFHLSAVEWTSQGTQRACFTNDDIVEFQVITHSSGSDPAHRLWSNRRLGSKVEYTGLSQDAFVDRLRTGDGCVSTRY